LPKNPWLDLFSSDQRMVAGLMSGTSMDGVDVVLVELKGSARRLRMKGYKYYLRPYSEELRKTLLRAAERGSTRMTCLLNMAVGKVFADALLSVLEEAGVEPRDIDLISSHGQTLYHAPRPTSVAGITVRSTLQIGEISVLAERVGRPTVGDFRVRDMAAGGEGAPIIAYVDYILFSSKTGRAVQNLGGIANVTVLPPTPSIEEVYAFDTGPGNMLIDGVVSILTRGERRIDVNGEMAAEGSVDEVLLERLMKHPFIRMPPPKTTGREEFGLRLARKIVEAGRRRGLSPEDIVATVTMFTVKSIIYNYDKYILPKMSINEVIVGGGGARNKTLMGMLREELRSRGIRLSFHEDYGIDSKAKEALGIAILGHEAANGVPNNVPGATGARRKVVMGKFVL